MIKFRRKIDRAGRERGRSTSHDDFVDVYDLPCFARCADFRFMRYIPFLQFYDTTGVDTRKVIRVDSLTRTVERSKS